MKHFFRVTWAFLRGDWIREDPDARYSRLDKLDGLGVLAEDDDDAEQ